MRGAKSKSQSDYRAFEAYVAFLYESLGFKVTRNLTLGGQEVDVLAERFFPGVGKTRVAIECKWRSSGAVSNQDIHDFASSVTSLRNRNIISRGVMVTNARYSPDAQAARHGDEDLELLTIGELENHLFDVRQVLSAYAQGYERSTIFSSYVPLRATWKRPVSTSVNLSEDIETTLVEWLQQESVGFVSILGDYGTGKTTLMGRLKYLFAQRYISGESSLLPILIPLKRFFGHDTLEDFLRSTIVSEFERDVPLAVFWRTLAEGRFLILLDGFDEMAAEADAEKRLGNFILLSPLIGTKSKVILTCRPAYFVTHHEYEEMILSLNNTVEPAAPTFEDVSAITTISRHDQNVASARRLKYRIISTISGYQPMKPLSSARARLVDLELFNQDQIDLYLKKFNDEYVKKFKETWLSVKTFMLNIYDLSDLMSRPILLTMINETILDGRIRVGSTMEELGASSIYELYTSSKLDLDWLKGESRRLLTKADRAAFAETIAIAMYLKGKLEITYAELLALSEIGPGLPTKSEYLRSIRSSVVASDLQVSTFLTRSEDEVFRFAHKSFVEFFVALNLKNKLLAGECGDFGERALSREILYFLGGFSIPEPSVRDKLVALYSACESGRLEGQVALRNTAIALLYSGPWQYTLRLEGVEISGIEVKKVVFEAPLWRNVRFANSGLRDLELRRGNLSRVRIDASTVSKVALEHGTYELQVVDTVLSDLEIRAVNLMIDASRTQLLSSRIEGGKILVSGDLAASNVQCRDASLKVGIATRMKFEDCTFHDSVLYFGAKSYAQDSFRLIRCNFRNCEIYGLRLPRDGWSRYVENDLKGCNGIVVVDEIKEEVEGVEIEMVQRKKILVVIERVWVDRNLRRSLLEQSSFLSLRRLDEVVSL